MKKPISLGQIWILEQMMKGPPPHMICTNMSTAGSPEPVNMSTLRGLEKRGLCAEGKSAFFTISPAGENAYESNKLRLTEFRRLRQAEIEEEYRRESEAEQKGTE